MRNKDTSAGVGSCSGDGQKSACMRAGWWRFSCREETTEQGEAACFNSAEHFQCTLRIFKTIEMSMASILGILG